MVSWSAETQLNLEAALQELVASSALAKVLVEGAHSHCGSIDLTTVLSEAKTTLEGEYDPRAPLTHFRLSLTTLDDDDRPASLSNQPRSCCNNARV
jgi:hypothetical protein